MVAISLARLGMPAARDLSVMSSCLLAPITAARCRPARTPPTLLQSTTVLEVSLLQSAGRAASSHPTAASNRWQHWRRVKTKRFSSAQHVTFDCLSATLATSTNRPNGATVGRTTNEARTVFCLPLQIVTFRGAGRSTQLPSTVRQVAVQDLPERDGSGAKGSSELGC